MSTTISSEAAEQAVKAYLQSSSLRDKNLELIGQYCRQVLSKHHRSLVNQIVGPTTRRVLSLTDPKTEGASDVKLKVARRTPPTSTASSVTARPMFEPRRGGLWQGRRRPQWFPPAPPQSSGFVEYPWAGQTGPIWFPVRSMTLTPPYLFAWPDQEDWQPAYPDGGYAAAIAAYTRLGLAKQGYLSVGAGIGDSDGYPGIPVRAYDSWSIPPITGPMPANFAEAGLVSDPISLAQGSGTRAITFGVDISVGRPGENSPPVSLPIADPGWDGWVAVLCHVSLLISVAQIPLLPVIETKTFLYAYSSGLDGGSDVHYLNNFYLEATAPVQPEATSAQAHVTAHVGALQLQGYAPPPPSGWAAVGFFPDPYSASSPLHHWPDFSEVYVPFTGPVRVNSIEIDLSELI